MNNNILVTGSNSGLGKYCLEYFCAESFNRNTSIEEVKKKASHNPYDMIIHSAFNTRQDITNANLSSYLNDTLHLTQQLLNIPHRQFIFISTVDVYPKNNETHTEEEVIALKNIDSIYGITKLICENYIQTNTNNYLILRPTALLGNYAKKNSLMRILTEPQVKLSLAENSAFNYVLHQDIANFIEIASKDNLHGIYNIASSNNINLSEVIQEFKPTGEIEFGQYSYQAGNISNHKALNYMPALKRSSLETIRLFTL